MEISLGSSGFRCPGLYCGITIDHDGNSTSISDCGACPRGFRANSTTSICDKCLQSPTFYSWLFLGFMAMLPLIFHWFCIDLSAKRRYRPCDSASHENFCFVKGVIMLHIVAVIEVITAACLSIVLYEPRWTFDIFSCQIEKLSDWYTMLHNPSPGYEQVLHCTQEAVYPLYTIVLVYYALCLVAMLILRPFLASKFLPGKGKTSIYAALYFLPILVVIQAMCGGLLYYSFPYITVIFSVISNAAHFAFQTQQSVKALVCGTVTNIRNLVILLIHWSLHAYGIIAIIEQLRLFHPNFGEQLGHINFFIYIALVPFPTIFYVLTARCTDPNKLHLE